MDIEIPTMKLAIKVWWAQFWRMVPLAFLGGAVVGLVVGLVSELLGIEVSSHVSGVLGGVVGIVVGLKVILYLMTKGFGEYRLAVVRK